MKLLIGYDGSECAADAMDDLRQAGLAPEGVEAVVASIADVPRPAVSEGPVPEYPAMLKPARERARRALDEAQRLADEGAERLRRSFPRWSTRAQAGAGSPYWGLIEQAEEIAADLLVVGSHGRSALGRLILGSVSNNTLLYARCSVRVGRCRATPSDAGTIPVRLIIGWDGSAHAEQAVDAVAARQWPQGSQVRLVTALDMQLASMFPMVPSGEATPVPPVVMQDETESLWTSAQAAADRLRGGTLIVEEPVQRDDDPKRVLLAEADAWNADCIFVGARGLSRMQRVLLGSVSGAVAARASCAVEIVRSRQDRQ